MPPPAPTVLIVDDNPATAESLAAYLSENGYEVRMVTTTLDAVTALMGRRWDAAVVDMGSAGGGLAVAEALAAQDRPPLMIGLLSPEEVSSVPRTTLARFDSVFTKAASPAALAERIAKHLATKTVHWEGRRSG
jgi:CheY-like chemotaxis protein